MRDAGSFTLLQNDHGWTFKVQAGTMELSGGPYKDRLSAAIGMLHQLVYLICL